MKIDKVYFIVPALHEEKSIGKVIRGLKEHDYHKIVVIADGSNDKTAEKAEEAGAELLVHIINRGQGAALRTGIEYALEEGAEVIVTFDSDGQHQAKDIKRLLKALPGNDIVLGSRFLQKNNIPFSRKVLLHGSRIVIWLFYGLWLTDAHNGLRAMTREAAKRIEIKSDRMEHASEIIGEIKRNKLRYAEVPMTVVYSDDTMKKGLGSYSGALKILGKMVLQKLMK